MDVKITCGRGGENLDVNDKDFIRKLSEEYKAKILRFVKDINDFEVHLKCFKKEGNVKRFDVGVRVQIPNHFFEGDSEDWDLRTAANKAFNKILNEIEHKCHASDRHGVGTRGKCR